MDVDGDGLGGIGRLDVRQQAGRIGVGASDLVVKVNFVTHRLLVVLGIPGPRAPG